MVWGPLEHRLGLSGLETFHRTFGKPVSIENGSNSSCLPLPQLHCPCKSQATVEKTLSSLSLQDEDGNGLTDEEIRAEVVTFFAAGQDTVAAGNNSAGI